jgi:outer membrane protein OmpA-like peptidoglycan-associated protein
MSPTLTDVGQVSAAVLSLFGGFPKKIAPPDKLSWLWTGLASLIAAIGFFVAKFLSSESWTYETFRTFQIVEYVLFGSCIVLCFAYLLTFRSKTFEYANNLRIVGTKLGPDAQAHMAANPGISRLQLMQAFGGWPERIWTSGSLAWARFVLAFEYAAFIALLAVSFNLGIELLAHPVAKPVSKEPSLSEEGAKLQDVHFDFNKSNLSEDAREKLVDDAARLGSILKKFPKATLIVEGHCDDQGGVERNLALGYERAEAVKKALVDDKVESSKITITSYGKGTPLCVGPDESCRQKNRRAHLRVVE